MNLIGPLAREVPLCRAASRSERTESTFTYAWRATVCHWVCPKEGGGACEALTLP